MCDAEQLYQSASYVFPNHFLYFWISRGGKQDHPFQNGTIMHTQFESSPVRKRQSKKSNEFNSPVSMPSQVLVRAKLEMTDPGDSYEQEADAVADSIVTKGQIARSISTGHSESGITLPSKFGSQLASLQGQGSRLYGDLKAQMESGFGRDFSDVRIHTDGAAAKIADSISAKAFTYGNDIFFNRGQFNPKSSEGQSLVAHELTHVVQGTGKVGRKPKPGFYFHNGFKKNDGSDEKTYLTKEKEELILEQSRLEAEEDRLYNEKDRLEQELNNHLNSNNVGIEDIFSILEVFGLNVKLDKIDDAMNENANAQYDNMKLHSLMDDINIYFDKPKGYDTGQRTDNSKSDNKVQYLTYVDYPSPSKHNVHLIIGHGTPDSIRYNGVEIHDPKELKRILREEGNTIQQNDIIVFASCELGQGDNSFAQNLSKLYRGSLVIAADEIVAPKDDDIMYNGILAEKVFYFCAKDNGSFNVFKNGKRLDIGKTLNCIYGWNSVMSNLAYLEKL